MSRTGRTMALALMAAVPICGRCLGGDWPHWRGPNYNGSSDETNLPQTWSETDNVAWVASLPGPSAATPIVRGGRVFVSSAGQDGDDLFGVCLDAVSGKTLWSLKLGTGKKNRSNTMASPSPVGDDERTYFLYGTGLLAAVTIEGKVAWSRQLGEEYGRFACNYGYSASPLLHEGVLYVAAVRTPYPGKPAFLMALEPKTGKTRWLQERGTDAEGETHQAYTSPIPWGVGGRASILLTGADYVTCHDAATGRERWRYRYTDRKARMWRLVPSPVVAGGLIVSPMPRGGALFAASPPSADTPDKPKTAWTQKFGPDVCTPALYKGLLYVLDERKRMLTCAEPATGKTVWAQKLNGRKYWASPTAADDKVYCVDTRGHVTVLAAGPAPKVLATVRMDRQDCYASIAVAGGGLFVRSKTKLTCIRKPAGAQEAVHEGHE